MAATVTAAIALFLGEQLECAVWDDETPRTDDNGDPINPDSTVVPSNWPVVKIQMLEPGMSRADGWNVGTDPYKEAGQVFIQSWATSKVQCQAQLDAIEALLCSSTNWELMKPNLGGPAENPCYFVNVLLNMWWLGRDPNKTAKNELLFRCDLTYDVLVHGAVFTR